MGESPLEIWQKGKNLLEIMEMYSSIPPTIVMSEVFRLIKRLNLLEKRA